jgi:D-sedoheptulose 7-phosphate isomerase
MPGDLIFQSLEPPGFRPESRNQLTQHRASLFCSAGETAEGEDMRRFITGEIQKTIALLNLMVADEGMLALSETIARRCIEALKSGRKLLLAGNGGSAADAQHLAAEFVARFYFDRPGLPAIALNTDTSVLTAVGNDYGFERLFARQVEALGVKGDVFFGISTSGRSRNVLRALDECRHRGIITVGMTGAAGGDMLELCDYCIRIPSTETPKIQEGHIVIGHIICALVEDAMFGKPA